MNATEMRFALMRNLLGLDGLQRSALTVAEAARQVAEIMAFVETGTKPQD